MLNYALYPNELTQDDPEDQIARPVDITTNKLEDLIKKVTGPGSILKPTEVKAVIDAYWDTITGYIREGEAYSDTYVNTRFDISGVFQNEDDQFDPARHSLIVGIKLKSGVSSAVDSVTLKKVDVRQNQPLVDRVYDWGSDTSDSQLSPGDVLEISGQLLKVYNNLEEEGVFFHNQSDGSEVKTALIRTNEPKTLTLKIPDLPAGNYRLEVRNTRHDGKTLRVGVFAPNLKVG
ncbi:MAG: DUF4469 domain-containing protein [Cyclobacteriaceae bacterium]|nr:DUF4469 domain-containing protein [Cyclobacteriaceae bacterium]